ncbi:LexA family protein [Hymenobacter canadensis]|uniref:Peptidase S24/S26A/S26B/S26C domain-containing protein n=1 Tax=Hymenobacter canadensis TaxID=2999067 RepID=A0ABY7LUG5_9BACT|nr:hypothetical protein [Hymenobacter canadensis]WBA44044.1 hypothetical protein O3303_21010 [Hymenobacter canadensis]
MASCPASSHSCTWWFASSSSSDELEEFFDLNRILFRHPEATYLIRVSGESMRGAEIHADDGFYRSARALAGQGPTQKPGVYYPAVGSDGRWVG